MFYGNRLLLTSAIIVCILFLLSSCGDVPPPANPPAPGFNTEASDPQAITMADSVMEAMGGRKAWDDTRVISWSFFGRRHLIWDKHTGDVRIDAPGDSTIYLINIFQDKGIVKKGEMEVAGPALDTLLDQAKRIWINDSYWLVMPFKLKDSGVTLKYLREEATQAGQPAHVLQLTFEGVGVTPQNRYEVWVDQQDHLIKQWAFYREAEQEEPNYIRPWDNYRRYGNILLSAERSDNGGPAHVRIMDSVPEAVFQMWDVPAWVPAL